MVSVTLLVDTTEIPDGEDKAVTATGTIAAAEFGTEATGTGGGGGDGAVEVVPEQSTFQSLTVPSSALKKFIFKNTTSLIGEQHKQTH